MLMIVFLSGFFASSTAASGLAELCSGSISLSEGQWASFAVDAPFLAERLDSRYAIVASR